MRPKILTFLLFTLVNPVVFGQNDQEAIKILNKFSANALGAPSVSMKFYIITTDQMENTKDTLTGSIILSRDKYKLDMVNNIIWFDGLTSWSYLPSEKEVTITKPDKKDNSFQNRPSSIFTMYKNHYKNRLIEEKPDLYVIDMYPDDIKSDLLRVRLSIGKPLLNLLILEYKKRDGIIITLIVKDYNLKLKPDTDTFIFKPGDYKDAEVIDMR